MEHAFGTTFDDVRVHTGTEADRSARALDAAAYTTGSHIVFAEGTFNPSTSRGRHLLAHELAHVVQQRSGPVDATEAGDGLAVTEPSHPSERAADRIAQRVVRKAPRRPAGPAPQRPTRGGPSAGTLVELQRCAGNAAVAEWAESGFGAGEARSTKTARTGARPAAVPVQRYSLDEFVSDAEGAASGLVSGAEELVGEAAEGAGALVDEAAAGAGAVVDWFADAAGSAALSAAQALVGALGGSLVITPTGFVITIPDVSLCSPFEIPILSAPPQGFTVPFPPVPIPIPPDLALVLYGGLEFSGTPSMSAFIGPCYLRNISIVFDFVAGNYSANGEWYVGAAISELLVLQAGVYGGALLMLVAPPIPLIWVTLLGGPRLFLRGSAVGGLQSTQSLAYNSAAGSITFSTLNSLKLGAILEADLDGFLDLFIYDFPICEWVWPLYHWETGDAIQYDLPITLGYGTGGPPVSIGPITSTPIPYADIEVAIDRSRPGTTCISLDEIVAELCRLGLLPPDLCPGGGALTAGNKCSVKSGPAYTPTGTIPVTPVGGKKKAVFSMAAGFDNDPAAGKTPSCCEVRQFIKWDQTYHNNHGGPPHSGFPASAAPNTWHEDRDRADKRYGHRSGPHSDPIGGCGDEYLTGGKRDQANGDTYCGKDGPESRVTAGQYQFQLKVIDTCDGNKEKASSSIITINW